MLRNTSVAKYDWISLNQYIYIFLIFRNTIICHRLIVNIRVIYPINNAANYRLFI